MNYQSYRHLFHNYTLQSWNQTKSFSISDDQRILPQQGNISFYPQLQLDTPIYKPTIHRGKTDLKTYEGQVAILQPVGKGHWGDEDTALDELEAEMDRLIAWLDHHRKLDFGYIRDIGSVYPIKRFEHDNLFGWAVQIQIEVKVNYCHDPALNVEILHLQPVYEEGENTLSIEIEGTPYSVSWQDPDQVELSLTNLAAAIQLTPPDPLITAQVFLDQLILIHSQPQTPINIDTNLPGHSWINNSL